MNALPLNQILAVALAGGGALVGYFMSRVRLRSRERAVTAREREARKREGMAESHGVSVGFETGIKEGERRGRRRARAEILGTPETAARN